MIIVYLIGGILVLSIFTEWYESRRVRLKQYECIPDFRRVCWGHMETEFGDEPFFLIKWPSYAWELDICRNQYCWHQRMTMRYRGKWNTWLSPSRLFS